MFKFLVIQTLNNLFDERTEHLVNDRLSFVRFDATLRTAGYLPMSGQILDATLVAAPKQRNTNGKKADLRAGRIPKGWNEQPARLSHKDTHALWTLKFTRAKRQKDGTILSTDLAIPFFGYFLLIRNRRQDCSSEP